MKTEKGSPGYIQGQKRIRTIRTAVLFAAVFAIFAAGMLLNDGDRRNIYSIIAAVGCIPAAMSAVSMIMIWMRKPVPASFVDETRRSAGDARLLFELYITTSEYSLYLHAAVIRDDTIAAFAPDPASEAHLTAVASHIRSTLNQACGPVAVTITKDIRKFRELTAELAGRETIDPDLQDEIVQILLALSL